MHHHILIKIMEEERAQLLVKLNVLEQMIFTYKNAALFIAGNGYKNVLAEVINAGEDMQTQFQKYHQYNAAQSTRNKVLFIIKTENRFLHVREIARIVQLLEDEVSIAAVIKKISPALSILKKIPGSPLVSIEVSQSHFNTFWGCRDWLTENGVVKNDFMYKESEITKLQKTQLYS